MFRFLKVSERSNYGDLRSLRVPSHIALPPKFRNANGRALVFSSLLEKTEIFTQDDELYLRSFFFLINKYIILTDYIHVVAIEAQSEESGDSIQKRGLWDPM